MYGTWFEAIARSLIVLNSNVLRECNTIPSKNNSHVSLTVHKEAVKHHTSCKDCVCSMFRLFLLRYESKNNCFLPLQIASHKTRSISSVKQKFDWSAEISRGTPKKKVLESYEKTKKWKVRRKLKLRIGEKSVQVF